MVGPGRPPKSDGKGVCDWCAKEGKEASIFVLPTQHGKREFCSTKCLKNFRDAYSKVRFHVFIIHAP